MQTFCKQIQKHCIKAIQFLLPYYFTITMTPQNYTKLVCLNVVTIFYAVCITHGIFAVDSKKLFELKSNFVLQCHTVTSYESKYQRTFNSARHIQEFLFWSI